MKKSIELCSIFSIKTGGCTENCRFCAQSTLVSNKKDDYGADAILKKMKIVKEEASYYAEHNVNRFSLVASGKGQSKSEIDALCRIYKELRKKTNINLCASFGLLDYEDFVKLKEAGVTRYHCNLETSREYFPKICTSHTFEEKINTIRMAQKAGLEICSGGIIGMGESMEDRISMAKELKKLGVASAPINFLIPIKGTPLEDSHTLDHETIERSLEKISEILGPAKVRLAGGRVLLKDGGSRLLGNFAGSLITGRLLTTTGNQIEDDLKMIREMGCNIIKN